MFLFFPCKRWNIYKRHLWLYFFTSIIAQGNFYKQKKTKYFLWSSKCLTELRKKKMCFYKFLRTRSTVICTIRQDVQHEKKKPCWLRLTICPFSYNYVQPQRKKTGTTDSRPEQKNHDTRRYCSRARLQREWQAPSISQRRGGPQKAAPPAVSPS